MARSLPASSAGGRVLGLTLSALAFILFNYLFLPPYNTLVIQDPFDWIVLAAFFVTSIVATQRIALAVAPAALGLLVVATFAYRGAHTAQAARILAAFAVLAAGISAAVAWYSARDVAAHVQRLADEARAAVDEREDWTRREHAAEARAAESMELLREAAETIGARLKDVQLPLHILLTSPFGELNENQEEILAAARNAADDADIHVRQLAKLIQLETDQVAIIPQPIGLPDLLRPALANAEARAAKGHVSFHARISQTAPCVVDPMHAQEALGALLSEAVDRTPSNGDVAVDAGEDDAGQVRIVVLHNGTPATTSLAHRLATHVLEAQQSEVRDVGAQTVVELPVEPPLLRAPQAVPG